MYSGKILYNITISIFDENNNLYKTLTINPLTNKEFTSIEEAENILQKELNQLNSNNKNTNLSEYSIYLTINTFDNNNKIIKNNEVSITMTTTIEDIINKNTIILPLKNTLLNTALVIELNKQNDTFNSDIFTFTESGIYEVDITNFININNLNINKDDIKINNIIVLDN